MTAPEPTDTGPVAWARRLFERFVPRGAILLTVLGLGYFAIGIVRNRVFANTYRGRRRARRVQRRVPDPRDRPRRPRVRRARGAVRPDLHDAPEPRRPRRDGVRPDRHDGRRRGVMARRVVAPVRGCTVARDGRPAEGGSRHAATCTSSSCASTAARRSCSPRRSASARSSIADRRFLRLRARADPLHDRDRRRDGAVRGHVRDRRHRLGRGRGRRRPPRYPRRGHPPDVVPDPAGLAVPDRGVRRVRPADDPADAQPPDRAADLHVPHASSRRASRSAASTSVNFALDYQVVPVSLIGDLLLAGGLPDAVEAYADSATGARFTSWCGRNLLVIGEPDDARGHRAVRRRRAPRPGPAGRRRVRPGRCRAHVRGRGGVRAVGAVRRPRLSAVARAVRDPRHGRARSSPRSPGWASSSSRPRSWCRRSASSRSRSATPSGWRSRTSLLAVVPGGSRPRHRTGRRAAAPRPRAPTA